MKRQILVSLVFLSFFLSFGEITAQNEGYPTHLFLGCWTMRTAEDTTVENWIPTGDGEYTGMTLYTDKAGTLLAETHSLRFFDGKLFYCATVSEQDPAKPEGEVRFELKSCNDRIFTFENPKHDFPKRITYDFSYYKACKVKIENENSAFDLIYSKDFDFYSAYEFKGKFIKETFENKIGHKIDGVYNYFYVIQGIKYFIKFSDSEVTKDEVEKCLDIPLSADVVFKEGLWDTDDPNVQSRIGNYVSITKINK